MESAEDDGGHAVGSEAEQAELVRKLRARLADPKTPKAFRKQLRRLLDLIEETGRLPQQNR